PGTVVGWRRQGDVATVPPLLLQPVAASDVGEVLGEIAVGAPQGRARDLAGAGASGFRRHGAADPGGSRGVDSIDPDLAKRPVRRGGGRRGGATPAGRLAPHSPRATV